MLFGIERSILHWRHSDLLFENAHKVGKGIEAAGTANVQNGLFAGDEKRFRVAELEPREVFDVGDIKLFLEFFGILFVGFCLCNVIAVTIDCVFDGFNSFLEKIMDLPFLLYLGFSFVISIVLTIVMQSKTK